MWLDVIEEALDDTVVPDAAWIYKNMSCMARVLRELGEVLKCFTLDSHGNIDFDGCVLAEELYYLSDDAKELRVASRDES